MATLLHNGFHGRAHLRFRDLDEHDPVQTPFFARISPRTAARLNRVVCGVLHCTCDERVAFQGLEFTPREVDRFAPGSLILDHCYYVYVPLAGEALTSHRQA